MGLKVVKLVAENVKGLKAVEIVPDGNFQIIAGANGQGKSSVLDVIWLALGGGAASKGTARPVREGSVGALASLDMGEFVVTRKWSSNEKSTLQVVSKEGTKFSSPQKMLDELIGKLSFDPLAFSNLDTKEQLKTLLELVSVDPTPIELEKKRLFDERTMINREVKALKAQFESFPYHEGVPEEEIQTSDILKEMNDAQLVLAENNEHRNKYTQLGNEYKSLNQEIKYANQEIERVEQQLAKMKHDRDKKQTRLEDIAQEGSEMGARVQTLVDPDMSVYHRRLNEVDDINVKVRDNKVKFQREVAYDRAFSESVSLTKKIEVLEEQKQLMIRTAKFPIDGLSFDESGVLYNGVPFKQCSAAERLKVSMSMAMALNPELRVIRILDGSLLDSHNMKVIEDMAKEKDYQVWIEIVDESGKVGITIENGEVKG